MTTIQSLTTISASDTIVWAPRLLTIAAIAAVIICTISEFLRLHRPTPAPPLAPTNHGGSGD